MNYVEHYNNHYLREGLNGAGTNEHEKKFELWKHVGYSGEVLDYGCGLGAMTAVKPTRYLGVDISEEAIRLARIEHPDFDFQTFTIGQLDCGRWEFVVAHSVFTHTPYELVPLSLRDIKNAMKTHGIIDIIEGDYNDEHVKSWHLEDFLRELERAGLKGQVLERIDWPSFTHTYLWIKEFTLVEPLI